MSTFDSQKADILDLDIEPNARQVSTLAVSALICSLIICCPILSLLGVLLGVIALVRLKSLTHLKGKGLAWSGIVIGVVSTVIWVVVSMYAGKMFTDFMAQTSTVSTETIDAGYADDYQTFRSHLDSSISNITDEEINTFIGELESRYGKFDSAFLNMEEQNQTVMATRAGEAPIPIRYVFETTDATGFIVFSFIGKTAFEFDMKIICIKIVDSAEGNIYFPTNSICAPPQTGVTDSK